MDWTPVKLNLSVDMRVQIDVTKFDDLKELGEAMGINYGSCNANDVVNLRGTIRDCWAHPDSEYQYSVEFDGIDDEFSFKEGELLQVIES